jgi:hypothetical protein
MDGVAPINDGSYHDGSVLHVGDIGTDDSTSGAIIIDEMSTDTSTGNNDDIDNNQVINPENKLNFGSSDQNIVDKEVAGVVSKEQFNVNEIAHGEVVEVVGLHDVSLTTASTSTTTSTAASVAMVINSVNMDGYRDRNGSGSGEGSYTQVAQYFAAESSAMLTSDLVEGNVDGFWSPLKEETVMVFGVASNDVNTDAGTGIGTRNVSDNADSGSAGDNAIASAIASEKANDKSANISANASPNDSANASDGGEKSDITATNGIVADNNENRRNKSNSSDTQRTSSGGSGSSGKGGSSTKKRRNKK